MRTAFRDDRGQINFVKILFFAGVVALGYFAWVYGPPFLDHQAIKRAVRTGCNRAYGNRDPQVVVDTILNGFREANIQNETIGMENLVERRPLDVDNQNIEVRLLDGPPPTCNATVRYDRSIVLPFLNKERTLHYEYTHREDLSAIKY